MALNKHFNVDTFEFEDRPKPKLWLLKPNGQRIERIAGVSKLQGTFKYTNLNQITFQISPTMFDGVKHEQVKNTVFDKIRNKYIIEFKYNNFRDYFVIDDLKEVSNESENIQVIADSLGTELNGKSMNEIEMLGSTIRQMYNKVFENYAPLWSIDHIDPKVEDVKRELTAQQGTVMSTSEQINTLFDTITIFDNINRKISVYHKDSVGTNRGLRVRENSYLKSFEDSMVSKDIITRLIPMGSNGLTIHSANPAGSDYIEDFSFFIKPFKRDANRNVIEHSDYMSDELCHALLDYEEFYDAKKEQIDEFTKRYTDILTQHSEEDFKLKSLNGIVERQEDRIELLKPKSEYIELGLKTNDFKITVDKSSYYILMLKNEGSLAHIKFDGKSYQLKSGEWTYIKIDTADFQDATKVDQKLQYKVEMVSATTRVQAVITRSSLDDYEEEDIKKIEEKYNYLKYKELRDNQKALVASIERRMKQFEDEKADLVASMNPKSFLSDELYKEREQFVYSAIWQEENHTDAKELFDDAEEQLKKKNNVTRTLNVGIVNFVQSLEHKEDWDKLNVGDEIVFSNKFFNKKLKAYITEMQIGFDENSVTLTLSDVFDYKDDMQRVSELLASTSSTSNQVNMHKQQIKESQGKLTKMTELIEGEWDANKQRVLAGNETVDIGSHGVKVVSNENPNEFVIMVGGVIAMTKDGGETFKTGVTPDGVNAEMLIGKMIIGEDLWLENESGTMRFNKDGLHIDASLFHLTTNDGKEDYFDKLKNDLQEEVKQQETRIKESYQRDIQNAIQESVDVENIINTATGIIQDTFADGIITDVEKKLINDTLSSLEKENAEYVQQIELALNHPYITDEDIVRLEQAYTEYDGMYETLVQSISESISDDVITSDESTRVNEAIVNFRDEVKEILVLVQEILETTRDNQLNHKIEQSLDYTSRLNNDLKDEMSDLNKSFEEAKKTIDDAISDGILDAAETESIKTVLMIMKSEKQDVENRYNQIIKSAKLSPTAKSRIVDSHTAYNNAFNDFSSYVLAMIEDGIANDTERVNYNTKYDKLNELSAKFATDFTYALEVISQGYADSVEGKLTSQIDGMKTEITADLKDVSDNLVEFKDVTFEAFKDGILSDVELSRIKVHQEMLEREYKDIDAGYQSVITNEYLSSSMQSTLSQKRTAFTTAHGNLINLLNNILQVGKITSSQKTQVNTGLTNYSTALAEYTKAMQIALDNISNNMASDIAAERVNAFSGVIDVIQGNINGLQSQVDNAIDTYYYGYKPTLTNFPSVDWRTNEVKDIHIGDFFLDTKTGLAYRFIKEGSTYLWKTIEDQVITDALSQAKSAQDTADGKRRVFVNTPIPPYDEGDMWVQGSTGDIMVCKVPRGKNASYVSSDWAKASKYTDDSKANQVLSDLNTFKQSANQNLTNLNNSVNSFQTTIVDAFDDRVIEMAEASSINHSIQLLNNEKARIDRQYSTLVNNSDLVGAPKTQLTTTYNAFVTASNSLIQTIQSAIADNKIIPSEKTSVDQKFVEYRTAITNLADKTNAAIDAIIRNVSAGEANKINERFEEWKSSEFLVESEKISQRVSGSSWEETYLPQINDKINDIQVGGRNYFTLFDLENGTFVTADGSPTTTASKNRIRNSRFIPVDETQEYILKYAGYVKSPISINFYFYNNDDIYLGQTGFNNVDPQIKISFNTTGTTKIKSLIKYNDNTDITVSEVEKMLLKLEKGNISTDWTPAPEDVQSQIDTTNDTLNSYKTTIEANNSFIEQNKSQILSSVSRSEVDATLAKIATYETSYSITSSKQTIDLVEYNSIAFNDNYSYEVVAKNNTLTSENVAVATFISKGKGKGFELTEIDNKGSATNHPRFVLNNGKPAITLYGTTTTDQSVSVIYTKYLGSASNIERTNSQIKQLSDEITLEVNKIHEETDMSNMLLNSEFSGTEGWMIVESPFSIPPRTEMSINTDDNLLLHNTRRDTQIIAKTSQYRFLRYVLSKPLTIGQTYTLAFDYKLLNGNNNNQVTILNYVPSGTRTLFNVSSNERNVYTFTATTKSTELLIYAGESGTDYCKNSDIEVSNATLIEGDKPLKYRKNSSKNVMKMTYNSNISYPAIVTNFMTVGKGQEVSIGEEVTMSTYIYIPSSSKDQLVGDIYFEVAGYENTKQRSNASIGKRVYFGKENFIYDTWVRYSFTETIPETTTNGKVNYIRALLRFAGVNQSINNNAVFYYGLPQLEKGNNLTKWTPAKLDVLSTEGLATKIALNPESINIISQNLNINTDVLTIKNTNGNFVMAGDSITITNNDKSNMAKFSPDGMTIRKDGVDRYVGGVELAENNVMPTFPMPFSWSMVNNSSSIHNNRPHVSETTAGTYLLLRDVYKYAIDNSQGVESDGKDKALAGSFSFFHNKRYLRIIYRASATEGNNLYITIVEAIGWKTNSKINKYIEFSEVGTKYTTEIKKIKEIYVDLGKPDNKYKTFIVELAVTGTSGSTQGAEYRFERISLSDTK